MRHIKYGTSHIMKPYVDWFEERGISVIPIPYDTNQPDTYFTPFYISNADFYSIKKIKKCKINIDGLTFSSSLWLLKK
jgi:hypothetical protein